MKRIVIKIGSRVLTRENGRLDERVIANLTDEVSKARKKGIEAILVTSGAVSVGHSVMKNDGALGETAKEQVASAVGQPKLMSAYIREFEKRGLTCAQILATRPDFAKRESYLSLRTVTENLLSADIAPIFNENDVLFPEELDFSDNDQLAVLVAAMTVADKLIILSSVDGLYENFSAGASRMKIVGRIEDAGKFMKHADDSKLAGKGGMKSKLAAASLATSLGIDVHIGNGKKPGVVEKIIAGEKIGTYFPARKKKTKALKSWLAAGAAAKGRIAVSTCLAEILRNKKTASVLFIGIERIEGDFSEKDIVEIGDEGGNIFGRGVSRYDSQKLRQAVENFKKMPVKQKSKLKASEMIAVHYDYFTYC